MISFRPLKDSDAGLLLIWMSSPHVQPFWTENGSKPEDEVEQALDLIGSDEGAPFIIELNKRPIGYIQYYACGPDQPEGALGIDLFIGDVSLTGEGLGPQILRQFSDNLLAKGATRLIIDPASSNARAISAFRKAGFEIYETCGDITLMSRNPKLSA
ncbi:GNAT family N-acetyltransferase [Asticcacaulis taihuensis]|uniref:GNAT family N-acetyltransferase n=1 Tax=Asticcacaulis taihuensis TaxID=260084 RepID=UPI003F7B9261